MFDYKVWANTIDQNDTGVTLKYSEEVTNGVTIVNIDVTTDSFLDMENGAGIDLIPKETINGFVADFRHSEFWCRPHFGTDFSEVPDEIQGLIFKKVDGGFGAILPIVSEQYKCVLKGTDNGVTARLFSWYDKLNTCKAPAFAMAEGENPYECLRRCTEVSLKALNSLCKSRTQRPYPEIFEYLGWCSWDAMQIRVNHSGMVEKCKEFIDKDIPVRWVIFDDMWGEVQNFWGAKYNEFWEMIQLMHASKLYDFEADPKRFPKGLKACIDEIKELGFKIGVWHPTTGYWFGIDKNGPIAKKLEGKLFTAPGGQLIHSPNEKEAFDFYNEYHTFLKNCGADFLKIDNQSMVRRFYKGVAPVGEVARNIHKAIEKSVGEHFDNNLINCMGMASENMWNRPVSAISRCSDDFMPENKEWFIKHILQCSYNCLVQGQFMWCDWDMWWTDDGQAVKNSVLRAISGGPIYVSDQIGRSRKEVIAPLVLSDGKILRCDSPATPTADCLTLNPETSKKIFKLQNTANGSGVIAAFNLDSENGKVVGTISPKDVEGLEGEEFAVYEHFSGELNIVKADDSINVTLASQDEFCLYILVPVVNGFAPIGDISKYISPKTIKNTNGEDVELYESGKYAFVKNGKLFINE